MNKLQILMGAMLISLVLAACATSDPELSAQLGDQSERLGQLEKQLDELSASFEELESAEMEAEHEPAEASAFELAVAQYVLDSAGFHAIDETLSATGEIDPTYISIVSRVARVVAGTQWPQDLSDGAGHLHEVLMEFEAALQDNDAEVATPLAGMAHDHQHDLSAAISTWLSGEMPMEGEHEHSEDEAQVDDEEHMEDEGHEHTAEEDMAAAHGVPAEAAAVSNPIPADDESRAVGGDVFAINCALCHGENGEGDGPAAAGLEKPPADLHEDHVQGLTDGALFHIITHGKADTPMPAWEEVLTEEQRWHVVNFLRTFKEHSD